MSFSLVSDRLTEIAKNLDDKMPDIIATASMIELMGLHKERIFTNGLNTDNEKLGEYSLQPSYFSEKSFIRKSSFKPKGKENKGNFKNGNKRKSMYLSKGYNEFRDIQGRQTKHIDFNFSGSLESGFRIYKFGSEVLYGNNDKKESEKIDGLTQRFSTFIPLTLQEREFLKNDIVEQAIIVTNG